MNSKNFNILLIVTLLLFSCNNSQEKSNNNESLIIPDSLPYFYKGKCFAPKEINLESDITIIHHLNGNCNVCLENIKEMTCFFDRIKASFDINVLIISHTSDEQFLNIFIKDTSINYPIYIDKYDEFYFLNNLKVQNRYKTIMSNNNNKIIAIGDLFNSEESKNLFFDIINQQMHNK